jgi:hypothetical protein
MHEIRHVIARMRLGVSDRNIAHTGAIGRSRDAQIPTPTLEQVWLDASRPLLPPTMSWKSISSAFKEQTAVAVPSSAEGSAYLHLDGTGHSSHDYP